MAREQKISVRLNDEEVEQLRLLCEFQKRSASNMIQWLITKEFYDYVASIDNMRKRGEKNDE